MKINISNKSTRSLISFIKHRTTKVRVLLLLITSLFLYGAIPYFTGSGLTSAKAISPYANGVFPEEADIEFNIPYKAVFPELEFFYPIAIKMVPNQNKIIVGQLDGKMFWFENDDTTTTKNSLLDISAEVGLVHDGGFLGLTLHPDFDAPSNPKNYAYIYYVTKNWNGENEPAFGSFTGQSCDFSINEHQGNFLMLERYEIDPTNMSYVNNSRTILLKNRMYGTTHYGGGLEFGNDGFLYLTTGDQASWQRSQDIVNNLDGGVLRMDVDKDPTKSHPPVRTKPADAGEADEITGIEYWIPNDNPFSDTTVGSTTNIYGQPILATSNPNDVYVIGDFFEEYYSIGLRNPYRMTKDKLTGQFYFGDVGLSTYEEVNVLQNGANFGWPEYEGFNSGPGCDSNGQLLDGMLHEEPLVAFSRSEANAVIGGFVYRGSDIPDLYGKYICADYGTGDEIFAVDTSTGAYEQIATFLPEDIISFGEDNDGELFILRLGENTNIYKLRIDTEEYEEMPQLLSDTGVFSNLSTLDVIDGFVPYELYESFWSDGALKRRWIAVPNTDGVHSGPNEQIDYSGYDDWEFPVGTVIVKHFDLQIDDNDPSITKKIETRFSIVGEDGEMYFLTYNWKEDQTDAVLQTSSLDESVNITTNTNGTRTQIWHFPSNSECLSCHNNANNDALGLKTRYLNTDYTYDETGITANQLVTLSHIGVLDQSITDADTPNLISNKSINDPVATLDEKARSYLDLNCAYCHRTDNNNRADFDLRLYNSLETTNLLNSGILSPLGIHPDEKIVFAGDASKSILYHRMNSVDPSIMMPPLSKSIIDQPAVDLIEQWINQLDGIVPTINDPSPLINLALLSSANVSGSVIAGTGRGTPLDILYDPLTQNYKLNTLWAYYGIGYQENLGTVDADNGFSWQTDWPNPKFINYITFGGSKSNQPQQNTMWRVSYLRDGNWIVVEEGTGGWIHNGIYEWDGSNQPPIFAESLRLQLFSDGVNDLVSVFLQGRGGRTLFNDDSDTEPKATLLQFLPFNNHTIINDIVVGAQPICNPANNTYSQDLTVTYINAPATGSLVVNGQIFPITSSPQTITLTGLNADGLGVEILAEFTDGYKSDYKSSGTLFNAPIDCTDLIIGVDETMIINSDYEVNLGRSIEILEGGSLTINGNFINNGQVILNSISNKYSSLIVTGSSNGNISYKRHVNAFNGAHGNDLIATPLKGDTFGNFATRNSNIFENPSNSEEKLFGPFNEPTDSYLIYSTITNASTALEEGTGFRAARDSSEDPISGTTLTFYGEIETGTVTKTITTSGSSFNGWNLIGNPYTSYIDFDTFFQLNQTELDINTYQAIYGYDGDASDGWTILNSITTGKLIAPGQGFFVKSKPGGGTITFTPAMRIGGSTDDFILGRSNTVNSNHLELKISSASKSFTTDFYFTDDASSGLDAGYDAALFGGNAPDFSLYSNLVVNDIDESLAIQVMHSDAINNVTIPLGIHATQGQQVVVSISESSIPENINIYLEDTLNNTSTLLNASDYTFIANSDLAGIGRFYLRLGNAALSTIEVPLENLDIFVNKNDKTIIIAGQLQNATNAKLYDIHGRVILSKKLDVSSTRQTLDISYLNSGIYIIELNSATSERRIQKLIIQ